MKTPKYKMLNWVISKKYIKIYKSYYKNIMQSIYIFDEKIEVNKLEWKSLKNQKKD